MLKYTPLKLFLLSGAGLLLSCSPMNDPDDAVSGAGDDETGNEVPATAGAWNDFAAGSEDNVLLDFSYAGYDHGESAPPEDIYSLYAYKVYNVQDYGAVPDDGVSDRQAFLDAVDDALGGKGWTLGSTYSTQSVERANAIIYFPPGEYILYDKETDALGRKEADDNTGYVDPVNGKSYSIEIRAGHFIIAGAGRDKTTVYMADPYEPLSGSASDYAPTLLSLKHWTGLNSPLCDVTGDSPKGGFSVEVNSAAGLSEGMRVALKVVNNDPDVVAEELYPYSAEPGWTQITGEGVTVEDMHTIASIEGNTVRFEEPLMHAVDHRWGWHIYKYSCYEEVGVEDITFKGDANPEFIHAQWADNSAYTMITMMRIANGWVRRCNFHSVSSAVTVSSCADVSVYDIGIDGNKGHHAVYTSTSSRTFIGKVSDMSAYAGIPNYGQHHSCGVSKPSIGTVIWRCDWGTGTNFEAHATQPRATLFDCCRGGFLLGHAGGDDSQLPNHLDDLTLWNFEATSATETENVKWWDTSRYWTILPPTIVGFHGIGVSFDPEQVKIDESHGQAVLPQSLYEAQLERRLGHLPAWIEKLK